MRDVSDLLRAFPDVRVLVLGDFMLDEYLWGHIQRISPEAPVPVLNLVSQTHALGGAGNVAKNLRSLGVRVSCIGVLGRDRTGEIIQEELARSGVEHELLTESDRHSTRKTRLMSLEHGQQVFRFDHESSHPIGGSTEQAVVNLLRRKTSEAQGIVCSDYSKGSLTRGVLQAAVMFGQECGVPVVIAPKDHDGSKYRNADALIPNLRELELLSGTKIENEASLDLAALQIIEQLRPRSLLVTRGSEGMSLFQRASTGVRRLDIATAARTVYDVTGAGDTVAAVFTAAIAAGADHERGARMANLAASIVVGKRGTATLTPDEMMDRAQTLAAPAAAAAGSEEQLSLHS
jgi:D-beta-D-heptose 7-phosphate kinase / D-beta-D-heptose 1-phosphate adenosyltransferase